MGTVQRSIIINEALYERLLKAGLADSAAVERILGNFLAVHGPGADNTGTSEDRRLEASLKRYQSAGKTAL
jgi:hypothetical protein